MSDMVNDKTRTLTLDEYKNFQKFVDNFPNHTGHMVEHNKDYFKVSFLKDVEFSWDEFFKYNDESIRGVS